MIPTAYWRMILPDARQCLSAHKNVTGVGLGCGRSGARARELVWRVYVDSPLADSAPSIPEQFPASLFGLPVEVFAARPGSAATKAATVYTAGLPIESKIGGSGFSAGPSKEGAIGCFAQDATGKPVLLTNSHVMFPHFLALSHLGVYQPDYSSCCSSGDKIAT